MHEQPVAPSIPYQKQWLGHPVGLYVCFATEMWERFSFYGMKFLLLLYLTKYHLFSDSAGLDVLGAYAGLVYAMPVIGGLLADRYLGTKKAVVFGGILLAIGHLLMAVEGTAAVRFEAGDTLSQAFTLANGEVIQAGSVLSESLVWQDSAAINIFYLALAFIVTGVGYLKPNISVIVGKLYAPQDPRRDSAFTLFYMGINVGAFLATVLCGWLGETYGWKYGFGLAGIGMVIGLVTFLAGQKYLYGLADADDPSLQKRAVYGPLTIEWCIYLGTFAALAVVWLLVQHEPVVHITQNIFLVLAIAGLLAYAMLAPQNFRNGRQVSIFAGILVVLCLLSVLAQNNVILVPPALSEAVLYLALVMLVAFIAFGYRRFDSTAYSRTVVLMVLICSTIIFWSLFEQSSASMTLFADRSVDRLVAGFEVKASQFGALNSGFIFLLAVPFALLWPYLAKRNLNPSTPVKFGLGLIQAGLGFAALVYGAQHADEAGKVAIIWLVLAYLFHSTGELCLSPIGLSAVTRLSISKVVGVSMGTWFLATALAETVATRLSKLASVKIDEGAQEPLAMLQAYTDLFGYLMWLGIGSGLVLLALSPLLVKGMRGLR